MDRLDEIRARYTPGNTQFRDVGKCTINDIHYLLAEIKRLQDEDFKSLMLERISLENGSVDMSLSGERAKLFMASLIEFFKQSGGENFLAITVNDGKNNFAINIQNLHGNDSPAQKINALTTRAEKAEAERDYIQQTLDMYGGEKGITAALKERDTYKTALQDMRFAYVNKDIPPHQFEVDALKEDETLIGPMKGG